MCLDWYKTWNDGTYCTVKTHRALWPACDYMGDCYYIATGLARKFFSLMPHFVCYLRLVFVPNSVPLCIVSAEAPGPAAVQKYSQWRRILEWIAWFNTTSSKGKFLTTESSAIYNAIYKFEVFAAMTVDPFASSSVRCIHFLFQPWKPARSHNKRNKTTNH